MNQFSMTNTDKGMAKLLASDVCICAHVESIIGNPNMNHDLPEQCSECSVCKNH